MAAVIRIARIFTESESVVLLLDETAIWWTDWESNPEYLRARQELSRLTISP